MVPNDTVTKCDVFFANQSAEAGLSMIYFKDNTDAMFGDAIYLTFPRSLVI